MIATNLLGRTVFPIDPDRRFERGVVVAVESVEVARVARIEGVFRRVRKFGPAPTDRDELGRPVDLRLWVQPLDDDCAETKVFSISVRCVTFAPFPAEMRTDADEAQDVAGDRPSRERAEPRT